MKLARKRYDEVQPGDRLLFGGVVRQAVNFDYTLDENGEPVPEPSTVLVWQGRHDGEVHRKQKSPSSKTFVRV